MCGGVRVKPVLVLAAYSFRMFLRDRGALFWGILFPLLLMGLIGLVFGRADNLSFEVSAVDESGATHAAVAGIKAGLRAVPVFKVHEESRQAALAALREGKRSLVVVLPPAAASPPAASPPVDSPAGAVRPGATSPRGTGQGYTIQAFYDESRGEVSQAALALLQRVVDQGNLQLAGVAPTVTVDARGTSTRRLSMFDFLLPGIMAMTLMQSGLMGVTWVVSSYREKLILKRVLTTPVSPAVFYTGLVARFTAVNLFQVVVIFLVATLVFHARTAGSLAALALLSVVGSVTFLGIGFAVSAVSKSAEAANNLGSLLNFPMMFLSGTFWPREMIPASLQPAVGALPLTPLVDAMRGVGARGEPLTDFLPGIAYLLAWGAAGFLVAGRYFRWD